MFILTFAVYMAGLYISNVESMFNIILEKDKKVALIGSTATDKDCIDYKKAIEILEKKEGITLLHQGIASDIYSTSVMGFNNGYVSYTFQNKEDFQTYCDFTGINIIENNQDRGLCDGSVIMSRLQAANRGMETGDRRSISVIISGKFRNWTLWC